MSLEHIQWFWLVIRDCHDGSLLVILMDQTCPFRCEGIARYEPEAGWQTYRLELYEAPRQVRCSPGRREV